MSRIRIRKPSDDKVSGFDIAMFVVTLAVIGVLVAWGIGWL